jgi:hypothetical protein
VSKTSAATNRDHLVAPPICLKDLDHYREARFDVILKGYFVLRAGAIESFANNAERMYDRFCKVGGAGQALMMNVVI